MIMEKKKIKNYKVLYNCDPTLVTDNHCSKALLLLDIDEKNFTNIDEAVRFLGECTSPITNIEDLVPELKKLKNRNTQWLLPESHIRPKHVLCNNMDERFMDY